jgi:hypothetical protein
MERPRGRLTARGPGVPLVNLRGADVREAPPYYLCDASIFRSPTVRTLGALIRVVRVMRADAQRVVSSPGPPPLDRAGRGAKLINGSHEEEEAQMDTTMLLIILIIFVIVLGGGWYGRGRWF